MVNLFFPLEHSRHLSYIHACRDQGIGLSTALRFLTQIGWISPALAWFWLVPNTMPPGQTRLCKAVLSDGLGMVPSRIRWVQPHGLVMMMVVTKMCDFLNVQPPKQIEGSALIYCSNVLMAEN